MKIYIICERGGFNLLANFGLCTMLSLSLFYVKIITYILYKNIQT